MTPGLAFFYGGMVRAKSVLNMMMMSFVALGTVSVLWVLYGYSMAFGDYVGRAGSSATPRSTSGWQGLMSPDAVAGPSRRSPSSPSRHVRDHHRRR